MICARCKIELVPTKVNLDYLGHRITESFPVCPKCGNVYIPESVASEKMQKIEAALEDK